MLYLAELQAPIFTPRDFTPNEGFIYILLQDVLVKSQKETDSFGALSWQENFQVNILIFCAQGFSSCHIPIKWHFWHSCTQTSIIHSGSFMKGMEGMSSGDEIFFISPLHMGHVFAMARNKSILHKLLLVQTERHINCLS